MKKLLVPLLTLCAAAAVFFANAQEAGVKPLRILLVAGGCCHDYETQQTLLKEGIEKRLNALVDVAFNPDKTTKTTFEIYQAADWAKDFDVVIHDECSADVTDPAYVKNILKAHENGVPAVNLHCAMHSYRWGNFREPVQVGAENAGWFEFLGLQSTGHGPQEPIDVRYTGVGHPITQGLADWVTLKEELYNNVQLLTGKPVATGRQIQPPKLKKGQPLTPDAKPVTAEAVVAWTNEYGPKKTRVFSTTLGHNNETVADGRYLDLVTRGLLWVTGRLEADGKPTPGALK